MDLRQYIRTKDQLDRGIALIRSNDLFYQPFILADEVEVGEAQNFMDQYANVKTVFEYNVYAPHADVGQRIQASDLAYFRGCNAEYRRLYDYAADVVCRQFDNDIRDATFAEIGCNTGINLFNLAVRGAKSCEGYDWNDMSAVFGWLNDVLGASVGFHRGTYNNLYHRFDGFDVPEVDVMINTIFTHHQCDPLQFLCYLCDRARRGVFLWARTEQDDSCTIRYPPAPPQEFFDTERPFPLYFNNDVILSENLLLLSFRRLGFRDVEIVDRFVPSQRWALFQHRFNMYYARRTDDVRSGYWQSGSSQP